VSRTALYALPEFADSWHLAFTGISERAKVKELEPVKLEPVKLEPLTEPEPLKELEPLKEPVRRPSCSAGSPGGWWPSISADYNRRPASR
jgi:hypothetical protein